MSRVDCSRFDPRCLLQMVLFLWLLPMTASAATYYVAKDGSDSTACSAAQNASSPRGTINGGIACLSGGDTLVIGNGTYDEQISTVGSTPGYRTVRMPDGRDGAYTTIRAAHPRGVRLRMTAHDSPLPHLVYLDHAHHVRLEGLVLDAEQERHGVRGCISVGHGAHHHQYVNLECRDGESGISGNGAVIEVIGGLYHGMGYPACWSSSAPPLPGYCHGVYLQTDGSAGSWLFDGVTFRNNSGYGVHSYVPGVTVRNSVFCDNLIGGIISVGGGGTFINNRFVNEKLTIWCAYSPCIEEGNRVESGPCPTAPSPPIVTAPVPPPPLPAPRNVRVIALP